MDTKNEICFCYTVFMDIVKYAKRLLITKQYLPLKNTRLLSHTPVRIACNYVTVNKTVGTRCASRTFTVSELYQWCWVLPIGLKLWLLYRILCNEHELYVLFSTWILNYFPKWPSQFTITIESSTETKNLNLFY